MGTGVDLSRKYVYDTTSDPAKHCALVSAVTYNCEGLMSALPFVSELLLTHDIIFIAETWISRSEERIISSYINTSCSFDCFVTQEFAMDFPPGAGAGRRHGAQWSF